MDSIFAKPRETELILVQNENGFEDPLAHGIDYEELAEDKKLQLNDTICEENEFQLHEFGNDNEATEDRSPISHYQNDDFKVSGTKEFLMCIIKTEIKVEEDSGDSFDFTCASKQIESDDDVSLPKPECDKKDTAPSVASIEPAKIDEVEIKATKTAAKCSSDDKRRKRKSFNPKKDSKPKKKRTKKPPVLKEGEKPARPYSKRNEIKRKVFDDGLNETELLMCKICDIQFGKSPAFTEHMRSKHAIDKPFGCHLCSNKYKIISVLAEHVRVHFNLRPYQCDLCERTFTQLQPLKVHIRKAHTDEKPYACDFVDESNNKCTKAFFDSTTYRAHVRTHNNEQTITCEICQKEFNRSHSSSFRAHMRIHTGERPYQCQFCGKSFVRVSTHRAHMLVHSDEFKYPCTWEGCTKKFRQASILRTHQRTHTGEKPFKCEICERAFPHRVTLRNHQKIHSDEKPFVCSIDGCGKMSRHRNTHIRHLQTHASGKSFQSKARLKKPASKPPLQQYHQLQSIEEN